MRTEIFKGGGFIGFPELPVRKNHKITAVRWVVLSLLIIFASFINCGDGAVTAYMNYVPNRVPQILELQSDFSGLPVPGDIITVTCTTFDPDGNPLSYDFTSGQGSFTEQEDTEGSSRITFVVGNISGGEDVNVSVTVTDTKDASAAATLNIGTSSMGPVITLVKPVNRTIGADGYSVVTFRSNMDGYYQVGLAGEGTPADVIDPEKSFFKIYKNTDTVFNICGPLYFDDRYVEGIPRLSGSHENRVLIRVIDGMDQVSVHEIEFDLRGTVPGIVDPEIRITDLKSDGMTLNWNFAADRDNITGDQQKGMRYRVYMSQSDNISTPEEAEQNGTVLLDWTCDINFFTFTGLTSSSGYYFNVAVKDSDELINIYNAVQGTTRESTDILPQVIYKVYNGTGVVINSDILIVFNREMNEETINDETILLRDSNGDDVPAGLTYGNGVVTVDPVDNLEKGMRYYLTVLGIIEDIYGDDLESDYQFSFTAVLESGSYTVRYEGNGATGGEVPVDNYIYTEGETVTVEGNTGNLIRSGRIFSGWNTAPDGSGSDYAGGESFTMGSSDQVLYARWKSGFVTLWKTDNPGASEDNQITIPVYSGETYDYTVDWGDGTRDTHLTGSVTHTYSSPSAYTVTITGTFPRISFGGSGDREKLLRIESWGDMKWTSMAHAFWGCRNLRYNAEDVPDLSGVTDMRAMFSDAPLFNGDLSNWDVSSVTNMSEMFWGAMSFNGDISSWDVSSVTNMDRMFFNARSFNVDISNWDISNVMVMTQMFWNAFAFSNHDLSGWNVSNVTFHSDFSTGWGTGNTEPNWP